MLAILLVGLLAIGAVSSADIVGSEDSNNLSVQDTSSNANLSIGEYSQSEVADVSEPLCDDSLDKNNIGCFTPNIIINTNQNKLSTVNNEGVLGKTINVKGTSFSDIRNAINNNLDTDTFNLDGCTYIGDGSEIFIDRSITINGHGAILDAATGSRIFKVTANNVVIKNITFQNGVYDNDGGAIYLNGNNNHIINCNFYNNHIDTDSIAFGFGGAIYFFGMNNEISCCNFSNNYAKNHFEGGGCAGGGAIYYSGTDENNISNCNFSNNYAVYDNIGHDYLAAAGGAIHGKNCRITNCNFENNYAKVYLINANVMCEDGYAGGGAIYLSGNISNCNFSNNYVESNVSGIPDSVEGGAVVSSGFIVNCNFNNNYVKSNGVYLNNYSGGAMIWGTAINCNFKNNTAIHGEAIYDGVAVLCTFEDNDNEKTVIVTDLLSVSDFIAPYNSGEKFLFNLKYNDFVLNGCNTTICVSKNGTFLRNYSALSGEGLIFDLPIGIYNALLSVNNHKDINPVTVTLTITDGTTFSDLNKTINGNGACEITLDKYYKFNSTIDSDFVEGIPINRPVTINGNGMIIDAKNLSRIFKITADNVTIRNITFINGIAAEKDTGANEDDAGAILWNGGFGNLTDCNFINNTADTEGGAVLWQGESGYLSNCNFTCNGFGYGAAVYWKAVSGTLTDCNFNDNHADHWAGAVIWNADSGYLANCNFTNNTSKENGGAVYWCTGIGNIANCIFADNHADNQGGAIYIDNSALSLLIDNSVFKNNNANKGNDIAASKENLNIVNNKFYGGSSVDSLYCENGELDVSNCKFLNETVFRINPIADGSTIEISVDETKNDQFNGTVDIIIGEEIHTLNITNGSGKLAITPNLKPGDYTAEVIFKETDLYYSETVSKSNSFHLSVNPEIEIENIPDFMQGSSIAIKLAANKFFTGNVTVVIGGTNYTVNIVDGVGEKTITTNLKSGIYNITASYSGNDDYTNCTAENTFNIVVNPKVVMTQASVLYTGKYSVTVYDKYGKPAGGVDVAFYINGKKVTTIKTDSKGVATFIVPSKYLPNKKYTIKATALSKTASKTVTVKQILKLKNVKVKKSAKKLVLTATLKKVNGKYPKGKVTFRFNGKKVKTVKINKKGITKAIVKKSMLKKLKVGKKVTYQVKYLKTTVKKKVKVKK